MADRVGRSLSGGCGWARRARPEETMSPREIHGGRMQTAGYQQKWKVSDGQAGRTLRRESVLLDPNPNPDSGG